MSPHSPMQGESAAADLHTELRTGSRPLEHRTLPKRWGPVLLAVSETSSSKTAATMAAQIADRLQVSLLVVTVIEPLPIYTGPIGIEPVPLLLDESRWEEHKEAVREHLATALGDHPWKLHVRSGGIAQEVCRAAQELSASLIVVSSAPHRHGTRVVAGVRAAQILRRSPCPVLSVAPEAQGLPKRIVSGIDFGAPSLSAAGMGLALAQETAHVTLVNVPMPFDLPKIREDKSGALTGGDLDTLFARTRELLEPYRPPKATIDTQREMGPVIEALLTCADIEHADLITLGTHGPGIVERLVLGSVAANLLHLASASVLAAPNPAFSEIARFKLGLLDTVVAENPADWNDVLDAFSRRNTGQRVTLEVDDPSARTQLQAHNYVFQGIVYDPHDRRVECMLQAESNGVAHLTRMIGHVRAIAIHAEEGRDRALEIRHEHGHTTLLLDMMQV